MEKKLKELRKTVLETSSIGNDGNLQSAFSSMEILWTLYDKVMSFPLKTKDSPDRDIFVLSKGQSNLALIAVLSEKEFFPKDELNTFCRFGSRISMQADRTKLPGMEISAGSLGHGFPIAVGMAWAKKINALGGRVFVLAGDGEMNEGTMWEAALFASSEKLDNLTLIIDDNSSIKAMLDMGDMKAKLESFGFFVVSVNGHDVNAIEKATKTQNGKPVAIIAKTVRGWGSNTLMNDRSWFHRAPDAYELESLKAEVDSF